MNAYRIEGARPGTAACNVLSFSASQRWRADGFEEAVFQIWEQLEGEVLMLVVVLVLLLR